MAHSSDDSNHKTVDADRFRTHTKDVQNPSLKEAEKALYTQVLTINEGLTATEKLMPFRRAAELNVSNKWLAQHAGVSEEEVASWKKQAGIVEKPRGLQALNLLEEAQGQFTLVKTQDGAWEVPEFLPRNSIHYTLFGEMLFRLATNTTYTTSEIAQALGFEPKDVSAAIELYAARALKEGGTCPNCDLPFFHRCRSQGCS